MTQKERDKIAQDKQYADFDRQMEEFRRKRDEMLERQTRETIARRGKEDSSA